MEEAQNTAVPGRKCLSFSITLPFEGVVYLVIRIRLFFAGLASGYQFRVCSDLINWTTKKTLEPNWVEISFFFETKHVGFAAFFFFACVHETTALHGPKSTVELRMFCVLFCDRTFYSWWLSFWIFDADLAIDGMFRLGMSGLWRVLVVAGGPSHVSQDAMWSGYADHGFPGNRITAHGGSLGSWKKDVGDDRSGATASRSHCLLSFVFIPAFPILLPESSVWGVHSIAGTPESSWGHTEFKKKKTFIAWYFKLLTYSY